MMIFSSMRLWWLCGGWSIDFGRILFTKNLTLLCIQLKLLDFISSHSSTSAHPQLLDLDPLPLKAFQNELYELLYPFEYFNPVQTQIFHTLYHSDENALVGAPTGSGKTCAAEMCIFRVFNVHPTKKVVYVAPLKALVQERMKDWTVRIQQKLGKKLVELTGDFTPDVAAIRRADLIVTTPEKWDGISRSWQSRDYVRDVALIIIDEIHLLGESRGPVLEVVVARTNFMSATTGRKVRVVGLSTALANAGDLADWLAIPEKGLFNFRPSVRPVPTEVHIAGFSGKHYCPRMATMNKPSYIAIKQHSPTKPVLIFVSSRRQTRLTASDLIGLLIADGDHRKWLWTDPEEMEMLTKHQIKDNNLAQMLTFGIGMHHAGLSQSDRNKVEELFVNQKIQVLIATSTLAWGVNFPAHLVIVKGTEIFDGATKRYVDMPVTDVLQMVGRAGRPQFDDQGVACVYVQDTKKPFYRKFLYEPFPVESSLKNDLPDHLNAEIVAGTITSKQAAMDYLTWTYFFRRLIRNPRYYGLGGEEDGEEDEPFEGGEPSSADIGRFLTRVVDMAVSQLEVAGCIQVEEDCRTLTPLTLGNIASYYYLKHKTVGLFRESLEEEMLITDLLKIIADCGEFDELPVRHNEDETNRQLAAECPLPVQSEAFEDPHVKAHLLYQMHFSQLDPPIVDYDTDRKSVIDNTIRIIQAMIDINADSGWLNNVLFLINLAQMVYARRWITDPPASVLPGMNPHSAKSLRGRGYETIPRLQALIKSGDQKTLRKVFDGVLDLGELKTLTAVVSNLPDLQINLSIRGWYQGENRERVTSVEYKGGKDPANLSCHADQDYKLYIDIKRRNPIRSGRRRAYTPGYGKYKEESWIIVLGSAETGELVALKRIAMVENYSRTFITFSMPINDKNEAYDCPLELYVMSDCYLGLDHQYILPIRVLPVAVESILNTELSSDPRTSRA